MPQSALCKALGLALHKLVELQMHHSGQTDDEARNWLLDNLDGVSDLVEVFVTSALLDIQSSDDPVDKLVLLKVQQMIGEEESHAN